MSKALKLAIEANDAEAARRALKTVKDLGRKLPKAEPPLIYAAETGADAVVEVLLEAGAPIPKASFEGLHPFAVAADKGQTKVLSVFAKHGVPEKVINHALFHAAINGRLEVARAILECSKPQISQRVVDVATWWKDGAIFKLLLEHGADVNARNDGRADYQESGKTPLHAAAAAGYLDPIRLLVDHGADVNATDALGRTPLMRLAAQMPDLDKQVRFRKEREGRVLTDAQKALQAKIAAQSRQHGNRENMDGMAAAQLLLERGADARRVDKYGNDALMYYEWERMRSREEANEGFVSLMKSAGAQGGGATMDLFLALRTDDLAAARRAIEAGANVNQDGPPPVSLTPLIMVRSAAMVALLLESGADANKAASNTTPLVSAARGGDLEIVKMLLNSGADIHAIEPRAPGSEYIANAFSAADGNRKYEVVEYLKSLGAKKPVLKDWKPLEPEIGMWENFSEVVVKGDVPAVAEAVAKLIGGTVMPNVYGRDLLPGKKTYVVL
ncbi:MAG TPA: ankyrin repeat domain-containing protein, partial [Candidatus Dormibacteraeota bacterium]|nr:ankyrin repeat domain-containing protein [Candidatus Dormibacteraeota bacterium]